MMRSLLTAAIGVTAAFAQTGAPDAAEQQAIVARVRAAAMAFVNQLQDFVCLQKTTRSTSSGDSQKWKLLETREAEVTYAAHKEHYKLLKVNGQTTNLEKRIKKGYFIPSGEFGSFLNLIFNSNTEFQLERLEGSGEQRGCKLRYRAPLATTKYVMQVNLDHVPIGHTGFVEADCDSGMVTRIHFETDPASIKMHGRDVALGEQLDVRYGPVNIGAKQFYAPLSAEEIGLFYHTRTKSEIVFEKYRKYEANSNITFEEPPKL